MADDANEREPPQVRGIRVQNFRCFDDVAVTPLGKVNILVGPNNVGKTALTLALRRLVRIDLNFHRRVATPGGLGVPDYDGNHMDFLPGDQREPGAKPSVAVQVDADADGIAAVACPAELRHPDPELRTKKRILAHQIAARLVYVPSNRRISSDLQRHDPTVFEERRYDGSDLLVELINARLSRDGNSRAHDVERFASEILGTEIELRPSVDPPSLLVGIGGDPPRPIEFLGEGITQSLAIAGAAASVVNPFLIIEDPELGLHPTLQRRLIDFLIKLPGAQALLTTHSNHILDIVHEELTVFRLQADANGHRTIEPVEPSAVRVLSELGVRPSSIAASNCVIWVEGPSDAIYLRYWLAAVAPDLAEWHDFTFSFFGGALLAHTSVDDPERLVRLMRVNPSFYLVADRDRKDPGAPLKPHLQRVSEEIGPSRLWITQGYEVESYVSDRVLSRACDGDDGVGAKPQDVSDAGLSLKDRLHVLKLKKQGSKIKKVKLARACVEVLKQEPPDWPLDLHERLEALAVFIRRCRDSVPACQGT